MGTSSPAGIYLLKVNNRNTRKSSEICSKLIIKTPYRRHWYRSGVYVNFEHISDLVLVFLLLILNMSLTAGSCPCEVHKPYPANIYFFKVNNRSIRNRCELNIKDSRTTSITSLVSLLLTLNIYRTFLIFLLLTLNS